MAIEKLYREMYFYTEGAGGGVHGYANYDEKKEVLDRYFRDKFRHIESANRRSLSTKPKLLDIGCALGFFLEVGKKAGWDTVGVDMSRYAIKRLKEKGIKGIVGTVFTAKFPDNSFDVVTCFQVLEHLIDPIVFLAEVRRILKPGGQVFLTTPDRNAPFSLILGRKWHGWLVEGHLNWFTKSSLALSLKRAGFERVKSGKDGLLWESFEGMADGLKIFYPNLFTRALELGVKLLPRRIRRPLLIPELFMRSVAAEGTK